MSYLLPGLLCFATLYPSPAALKQHIDRLQVTIAAHKNQIASQAIVIHFSEGVMDLRTESRVIFDEGSVQYTAQTSRDGTMPKQFQYLPATLINPLRRLPDQSGSIKGTRKAIFRILADETIEGSVYKVVEVTQRPSAKDLMDCGEPGRVLTKMICKLYIGKDGMVQRKSGVIFYKDSVSGKASKEAREQSAPFESFPIQYRDAPLETPASPVTPTPTTT